MTDVNTIASYLVSLGYNIDASAYRKFEGALRNAQNVVEKHTSALNNSFIKASFTMTGAIGTMVASTGLLLQSLAKADLGYEKLALRMYMTKEAAKQYSLALKVMGESPEDIRWIPELQRQYRELMADAKRLEPSKEYGKAMEGVRGIKHEFNRLKLESIYGLQWIGESIIRHLRNPLDKTKWSFSDLNEYIIQHIPEWSEKIGKVLGDIVAIFKDVWNILKDVGAVLREFWDALSPTEQALIGIGILTGLFLWSGPFGKFMILIPAIIALMSEFWGAMQGKETDVPIELLQGIAGALDLIARSLLTIKAIGETTKDFLSIPAKVATAMYKGAVAGYKNIPKTLGLGNKETEWNKVERQGAERGFQSSLDDLKSTWGKGKDYSKQISDTWDINKTPLILGHLAKEHPKFYLSEEERKGQTKSEKYNYLKNLNLSNEAIEKAMSGDYSLWMKERGTQGSAISGQLKISSDAEKYRGLVENTFGKDKSELFMRIMQAESGGNRFSHPTNKSGKYAGTIDYGLFQINSMHMAGLKQAGIINKSMEELFDPEINAKAAKWLYEKQGENAWKASRGRWGGDQLLSAQQPLGAGSGSTNISNSGNKSLNITINANGQTANAIGNEVVNKAKEAGFLESNNNAWAGVSLVQNYPAFSAKVI
jgi:hypothetical protein